MKKNNKFKNTIIFFDRDGVLVPSREINNKPTPLFKLGQKIDNVLKKKIIDLKNFSFLFMVTNQPDIARGKKNCQSIIDENNYIKDQLQLDDWAMCIHDNKDNCNCRKPKVGMFEELLIKWNLDKNGYNRYMLGDRLSDMYAGDKIGCTNLFIDNKYKETKDILDIYKVFNNTLEAINYILANYKNGNC